MADVRALKLQAIRAGTLKIWLAGWLETHIVAWGINCGVSSAALRRIVDKGLNA